MVEVCGSTSAGPRVHEKTNRCIQSANNIPSQKETSVELRMSQPKYGVNIAKKISAYSRARGPTWPAINGPSMPNQRASWDSNQILADVKHEPKSHGMKEISAWRNKNRGRVSLIITHKPSYRRTLTRASDEINDSPSNNMTRKDNKRAEKCRWYPHPTNGRHFPRSQHALDEEEGKVPVPPEQER